MDVLPRALLHLARQVRQQVEAVQVDLECLVAHGMTFEQLVLDIRFPGGCEKRGQLERGANRKESLGFGAWG